MTRWKGAAIALVAAIAGGAMMSEVFAQGSSQGRCGLAPGTPRPEGLTVENPYGNMAWLVGRGSFCTSSIDGARDVRVAGAPQHGTIELSGTRYTYRPQPGYLGPDEFTIGFVVHDYRTARGAVHVTLTVVP